MGSCGYRIPTARSALLEPRPWEARRLPTAPSVRARGHLKVTAVRAEQTQDRRGVGSTTAAAGLCRVPTPRPR